jgi:hypothetical protein
MPTREIFRSCESLFGQRRIAPAKEKELLLLQNIKLLTATKGAGFN